MYPMALEGAFETLRPSRSQSSAAGLHHGVSREARAGGGGGAAAGEHGLRAVERRARRQGRRARGGAGTRAGAVGGGDLDVDLGGVFVIEGDAGFEAQRGAVDLEAVIGEGKAVAVGGIGIDDGEPRSEISDVGDDFNSRRIAVDT